jgi:hypothetical protein
MIKYSSAACPFFNSAIKAPKKQKPKTNGFRQPQDNALFALTRSKKLIFPARSSRGIPHPDTSISGFISALPSLDLYFICLLKYTTFMGKRQSH